MNQGRINCMQCKYYYVTWDYSKPKGCKAFGFKSQALPSLVAFQSSGVPCLRYEPKENGNMQKGWGKV